MSAPTPPRPQPSALAQYWVDYGGVGALLRSRYLQFAAAFSLAAQPLWAGSGWVDLALEAVPSLLGFIIGAYALLLTLGTERFRAVLHKTPDRDALSLFEKLNAAFAHYAVAMSVAFFVALLVDAWVPAVSDTTISIPRWALVIRGVAFWLFAYSMSLGIAATLLLFMSGKQVHAVEVHGAQSRALQEFRDWLRDLEAQVDDEPKYGSDAVGVRARLAAIRLRTDGANVDWNDLGSELFDLEHDPNCVGGVQFLMSTLATGHDFISRQHLGYSSRKPALAKWARAAR